MWLRLKIIIIINSSALFFWGVGGEESKCRNQKHQRDKLCPRYDSFSRSPVSRELALGLGEREGKLGLGRGRGGRHTVPEGDEPAGGERASERVCSGSE